MLKSHEKQDAIGFLNFLIEIFKIVKNIADFPFEFNDVKERITISAGMAEFPVDSDNDDSLINLSDEAMYDSK